MLPLGEKIVNPTHADNYRYPYYRFRFIYERSHTDGFGWIDGDGKPGHQRRAFT